MTNEEFKQAVEEFNSTAQGIQPPLGTPRNHTERVNALAEEFVEFCLLHLEEGEFSDAMRLLSEEERAAFFMQLSDAFGDSTDE